MEGMVHVPPNWSLWRKEGRTHGSVMSHISIDDGQSILCGRDHSDMVFEFASVIMPAPGRPYLYEIVRAQPILHGICLICWRRVVDVMKKDPPA